MPWSLFGGDPGVVGRGIRLNDQLYTVIGVVSSDDVIFNRASVIVLIGQWTEPLFWDRSVGMSTRVLGRLNSGVSAAQAQSELDAIAANLAHEYPKDNA
jgi:putative ABC transport system permease protein